jgi:NTP pyrophosphatase (non-canonical NTP hydrolase)
MNWADYKVEVMRTAGDQTPEDRAEHAVLGMMGELGEIIELKKKALYNKKPYNHGQMVNEIGDFLWYYCLHPETPEWIFDNCFGIFVRRPFSTLTSAMYALCQEEWVNVGAWINTFAKTEGITIEECFQANVDKLRKRYPDGYVDGGGIR